MLEDLEEFVDVMGLDDLGNLEEMEVFAIDEIYSSHSATSQVAYEVPNPRGETVIIRLEQPKLHVDVEVKRASNVRLKSEEPALEACDVDSLLEQFEATSCLFIYFYLFFWNLCFSCVIDVLSCLVYS